MVVLWGRRHNLKLSVHDDYAVYFAGEILSSSQITECHPTATTRVWLRGFKEVNKEKTKVMHVNRLVDLVFGRTLYFFSQTADRKAGRHSSCVNRCKFIIVLTFKKLDQILLPEPGEKRQIYMCGRDSTANTACKQKQKVAFRVGTLQDHGVLINMACEAVNKMKRDYS